MRLTRRVFWIPIVLLVAAGWNAALVLGHSEREASFPDRHSGSVPAYRSFGSAAAHLVVCKGDATDGQSFRAIRDNVTDPALKAFNTARLAECGFQHIQAAVNAVSVPGSNIYVLPGLYLEEPSLAAPSAPCANLPSKLTYAQQAACPHVQNLIAVLGDEDGHYARPDRYCQTSPRCFLQIEGTGDDPRDVLIDGQWKKLNGIRGDRADGLLLRNLATTRTDFNGVYVLETNGFSLLEIDSFQNYEYGILTFAVDHGYIADCNTSWNGDSGVYPGSASDLGGIDDHAAVEITRCDSHHNALGYSGTSGNSVWAHHNRFHHNMVGVSMDSFFPGHPGLPQDSSVFEHNWIYSNNENYYENYLAEHGTPNYFGYQGKEDVCKKNLLERDPDEGLVCPVVPVPVGTGLLVAGGNNNTFRHNWLWDNWRYGFMLLTVPAPLRDEMDPALALDTSHDNRYQSNVFGRNALTVAVEHNGFDVWWDEGGRGNCWSGNTAPGLLGVLSDPPALPSCADPLKDVQRPPSPKLGTQAPCALFDKRELTHPPGCTWMETPSQPWGRL